MSPYAHTIPFPHMLKNEQSYNDNQLFNQIMQHDLHAFEQFYDRHAEVVYGLILHIVQDRSLADELLQETFLQVWSQSETKDSTQDVSLWLYQLARRRCLDALRWSLRSPQQQIELTERIHEQARKLDNGSYGLSATVLVDFTDEQIQSQRESMWRTFQTMAEEQRTCLSLAFFAGMTDQEISNYLNFASDRVRSLIANGIERLSHTTLAQYSAQKERV